MTARDYVPVAYRIQIVCTDRGQHGRMTLDEVVVREDGTFDTATTRKAALPGSRDLGSGIGQRVIVSNDGHHADYDGRRRWVFECAACAPRRKPINELSMAKIVEAFAHRSPRVVDISKLP